MSHLSLYKVGIVMVIAGAAFIGMHYLGHKCDPKICNICRLLSKG